MKRLAIAVLVGILIGSIVNSTSIFAVQSQGPESFNVTDASGNSTILVNTSATVYTQSYSLDKMGAMGLSYKASSVNSTPNVKIELQQSFTQPTTEGSADNYFVEPENLADIESALATETWHHKTIYPVPVQFFRYKITENSGSVTDTLIEMKASIQKQ